MDISFELYKVFYHVAKNLSFSTASTSLYVSQSAVSQSVRLLEEKLQCRLFIRNTKQVKLTQEGELLFKHVEQAFNFIKSGERGLSELHALEQGEVRIGASDTICKYHLLPCLKEFNRLYPKIHIHVTNRTSPKCLELLENGSVDAAVVNIPAKGLPRHLQTKKIKAIQDVFIAGQSYAHLQERIMPLAELQQYPLLMLEKNTTTRNFIDAFLAKKGIRISPEIELGSVDLLIELAKIGLGIAFVVKDYIAKELAKEEVFILKIKEKTPQRDLGIVTKRNVPLPVAAQKFVELL